MEKLTVILVVCVVSLIGYIACNSSGKTQTTFNNEGVKTVVAYCEREIDCNISIGKECEEQGFSVVKQDHFDQKTVFTATCGKKK